MMIAWYFATALAKQYDAAVPFLENRQLDVWTHNKAIQKAVESYRITPEQKSVPENAEGEGGTVNSPVQAAAAKNIRKRLDYLGRIWYNRYCRNRAGQRLLRDAERKAEPEKPGETER